MKTKFKFLLLLPFFALLVFTSCQEETVDITPPDEEQQLVADSELTGFIGATAKKDGSKDNIIDRASCLSVKLPVVVKVKGLEIKVTTEADYELIEKIYDEFDDDIDKLDIIFPITIITSEHEEIVINNAEELAKFVEECKGENEEDEDIECIDFQYPISFSVFNVDFEIVDVVTIESDRELHKFIKRIKNKEVIASLNFPVTMVLADGTTIEVNSNEELATTIREAKDACDEDDDNDINDDDFTKERLDEYLKECPWIVYEFKRNNQDNTDGFAEYVLDFKGDGIVKMLARNGDVLTGTWKTRVTDRGALLKMEFESLVDFTLEWLVYDFEDGKIKLYEDGGNRIILKRNCDVVVGDITIERVESFLKECSWKVDRLKVDGIEFTEEYIGTPLTFFDDNVVKIRVEGELLEGTYSIFESNNGIALRIDLENRPNLKLEWAITFLNKELIKLSNENNEMILRRHCPDNDEDLNFILDALVSGNWEVTSYINQDVDETNNYADYVIGFSQNGMLFAEGGGNNYRGSWLTCRNEGLYLGLNFKAQEEPFSQLRHQWKIEEFTMDRIELKDYSSDGKIERMLILKKRQV